MTSNSQIPWPALEAQLARDLAGRGIAAAFVPALPGDGSRVRAAATELAGKARAVAIVTGFCIPLDDRVTAETDGPPGVIVLAHALAELGIEVALVTDVFGRPLLEASCDFVGLPRSVVVQAPLEDAGHAGKLPQDAASERRLTPRADAFVSEFLGSAFGRRMTHLVSIERAGPSHTRAAFLAQRRAGEPPLAAFDEKLPFAERDACHNMRGLDIDNRTARLDRLFDAVAQEPGRVKTIAVGDGGNEIGCGEIPWERFAASIPNGQGGRIACRVAVETLIPAGVSNWGGHALAFAVAALRGRRDLIAAWDQAREALLLEKLVTEAGAVDGVTRQFTATVDGLDLATYFSVPAEIRQLLMN